MVARFPDVRWCSLDQRLGGNSPRTLAFSAGPLHSLTIGCTACTFLCIFFRKYIALLGSGFFGVKMWLLPIQRHLYKDHFYCSLFDKSMKLCIN